MKKLILFVVALLMMGCVPRGARFAPKAAPRVSPKPTPRATPPAPPGGAEPAKGGFKLPRVPLKKLLPGKEQEKDRKPNGPVEPPDGYKLAPAP